MGSLCSTSQGKSGILIFSRNCLHKPSFEVSKNHYILPFFIFCRWNRVVKLHTFICFKGVSCIIIFAFLQSFEKSKRMGPLYLRCKKVNLRFLWYLLHIALDKDKKDIIFRSHWEKQNRLRYWDKKGSQLCLSNLFDSDNPMITLSNIETM